MHEYMNAFLILSVITVIGGSAMLLGLLFKFLLGF